MKSCVQRNHTVEISASSENRTRDRWISRPAALPTEQPGLLCRNNYVTWRWKDTHLAHIKSKLAIFLTLTRQLGKDHQEGGVVGGGNIQVWLFSFNPTNGLMDDLRFFFSFLFLSPSLWETARCRLKYCLKGPLSPTQPTCDFTFFNILSVISG